MNEIESHGGIEKSSMSYNYLITKFSLNIYACFSSLLGYKSLGFIIVYHIAINIF